MRLSVPACLVLWIAAFWVFGRMFLHAKSCTFRLRRACRLYSAGDLDEGDRVAEAVKRSRAAFRERHPHWRFTPTKEVG